MHIVIVGSGVVGSNLAKYLAQESQNIALVDANREQLEAAGESIDCLTVHGDGARPSVLRKAGIEHADMVIAVTSNDTANIVICLLAERFGVKHKVARVRNPEYRDLDEIRDLRLPESGPDTQLVGPRTALSGIVDTIVNPDEIIVRSLEQYISSPGSTEVADFADGEVQLRKFMIRAGSPLCGKRIHELSTFTQQEAFLVVAIDRGEDTIVPTGTDEIREGDCVTIVMPDGVQPFVLPLVGHTLDEVSKVVIAGANSASLDLAERLRAEVDEVLIIEEDEETSEVSADLVSKARVFHGNTTDEGIHREVGMSTCDYFVAMTPSDEHNLLSCLLAKRNGASLVAMVVS